MSVFYGMSDSKAARALALSAPLAVLVLAWFLAAEAGLPDGGLSRSEAVAQASQYVSSSTPINEQSAIPGPYLAVQDGRPLLGMVWWVTLRGDFGTGILGREAGYVGEITRVTVVINYFNGNFVSRRFDT